MQTTPPRQGRLPGDRILLTLHFAQEASHAVLLISDVAAISDPSDHVPRADQGTPATVVTLVIVNVFNHFWNSYQGRDSFSRPQLTFREQFRPFLFDFRCLFGTCSCHWRCILKGIVRNTGIKDHPVVEYLVPLRIPQRIQSITPAFLQDLQVNNRIASC